MTIKPFEVREVITLRSRDMRNVAYAESHAAAIRMVLDSRAEATPEASRGQELLADLETIRKSGNLDYDEAAYEAFSDWAQDATQWINNWTPDGWSYEADENDPSYGGFYPIDENGELDTE